MKKVRMLAVGFVVLCAVVGLVLAEGWEHPVKGQFATNTTWTCPVRGITVKLIVLKTHAATSNALYTIRGVSMDSSMTNYVVAPIQTYNGTNTTPTELMWPMEYGDKLLIEAANTYAITNDYVIWYRDPTLEK